MNFYTVSTIHGTLMWDQGVMETLKETIESVGPEKLIIEIYNLGCRSDL